jgi:hypothetical protein
MCAGLELQELTLEGREVDCEGCVWWGPRRERVGKEGVVCLVGGLLGDGLGFEWFFACVWRCAI